jgi:N-acetylglutamate synthase-like GNAT family acetyltransferase
VITTRRATAGDAPAVTTVVLAAFAVYVERLGGVQPWPMSLDYAEVIADGQTWVADDAGEVAGVLVLEDRADHLLLEVLAVAPEQQGSGVGHRLMALADQQAADRGYDEVRLFTNARMTENLGYYPRQGYVETHRDEVNGFHRVFFAKRL